MTEKCIKNEHDTMDQEVKDEVLGVNEESEETFSVVFTNGALKKLKNLAAYLSVSENELGDVLTKGMKIIDAVKDAGAQSIVIESKDGKREIINIKEL